MQIDGYFNAQDEPVIKLDIGSGSIEVLLDTGFGGGLIIPNHFANQLDLKFEGLEEFYSVTEERIVAKAYSIEIDWFDKLVRVPVVVSTKVNEALLGGQMLKDCCLTIDYGRRTVTIVAS